MTYSELIDQLFHTNLFGGVKLGLKNVELLLAFFGHPEKTFTTIHIAGTNGKGSVTTKIAKGLESAGLRVGLYTSPHINTFRERMQINGTFISEEEVCLILSEIFSAQSHLGICATFFELTTVLAFRYFAIQHVDTAVIETGLGGRLDATNVITPKLSVITTISLEHTEILGDSIKAITKEKAGIIKPSIPVVIGPGVPQEYIEPIANERKSPLFAVKGHFETYEEENKAIAKKAMQLLCLPCSAIDIGLLARPPCRSEVVNLSPAKPPVILDVAHNPDGLNCLFQSLQKTYAETALKLVFGLSSTKDLNACIEIIKKHAEVIYLVEAPNGRGFRANVLRDRLIEAGFPAMQIFSFDSIAKAIYEADKDRTQELLVVTGSFFIMSEARKALGFIEPCDPLDVNERTKKAVL